MSDSIVVKVIDLWAVANLMKKDKMSQVRLTIIEADENSPASISFEACSSKSVYDSTDYEDIYAVSNPEL